MLLKATGFSFLLPILVTDISTLIFFLRQGGRDGQTGPSHFKVRFWQKNSETLLPIGSVFSVYLLLRSVQCG